MFYITFFLTRGGQLVKTGVGGESVILFGVGVGPGFGSSLFLYMYYTVSRSPP